MDQLSLMHVVGILGNILVIVAYLPQILKIIKSKSAEDISMGMWLCYSLGDALLLIYSWSTGDWITISLFALFVVLNSILLFLTLKYGKVKPPSPTS